MKRKVWVKSSFSFLALLFILGYYLFSFNKHSGWKSKNVITSDSKIYYSYLPAAFIYNDLHFTYADSLNKSLQSWEVTGFVSDDGRICQKMSAGKAIMDIPFFIVAHAWAKLDDNYQSNGYDSIYHLFIGLAGLFYGFLALVYIRKILKIQFPDYVVAAVILLLGCATNLLYYSAYHSGMAHPVGLFLVSFFIWNSIRYADQGNIKALIQAMFALGMAMIVRPTNVIFGVFLLVYLFESKTNFTHLLRSKKAILFHLLAVVAFLIPIFIQMGLWKYISGHWFQYSYQDEGFFFGNPKVFQGLFSARNGVFLYAPILILSFFGMIYSLKVKMKYSLLIPLFIFIYVIYSWWCWWYGGSFGSRAFIESYAILAVFLALFLHSITKKWNKKLTILVLLALVVTTFRLTKKQTWLSRYGVLHWDSMTYLSYWDLFPNGNYDDSFFDHLEAPDYENAKKIGKEYVNFKSLDQGNSLSEETKVSLANYQIGDTLKVVCGIWDNDKVRYDKKSWVYLQIENELEMKRYEVKLQKNDKKSERWNYIVLQLPIDSEMVGKILKMRYKYMGDSRCFYKDLEPTIITSTNNKSTSYIHY